MAVPLLELKLKKSRDHGPEGTVRISTAALRFQSRYKGMSKLPDKASNYPSDAEDDLDDLDGMPP